MILDDEYVFADLDNRDPETGAPLFWSYKHRGWFPMYGGIHIIRGPVNYSKLRIPKGKRVKIMTIADALKLIVDWTTMTNFGKSLTLKGK